MFPAFSSERPPQPLTNPARVARDTTAKQVTVGLVGCIFAVSGPTAIMLAVGNQAGMDHGELASWLFGAFFINGFISLIMCWTYRQPVVFLWSIPGIVLVGPALEHMSFAEVLGAYYAAGAAMLILGLSGWVRRIMEVIPLPIVMGMVAGVFLQFGLDWIKAFTTAPVIAFSMTAAFFATTAVPAVANRIPPLIVAIAVGAFCLAGLGDGPDMAEMPNTLATPIFQLPAFSWQAMLELVVPLMVTVLAAQNSQGITVLTAAGHRPPINTITSVCGIGSLITATVGTVSTCLTGPLNAILAGGGTAREGQYTAALLACIGAMLFGLFAPFFTSLMLATPAEFIATLAGIALLNVLRGAFMAAFRGDFAMGGLISFMVTVSDISLFNIGAPFWGLVFGFAASWMLERHDFEAHGRNASG